MMPEVHESWMDKAACTQSSPDAWFPGPEQSDVGRQAKRICRSCPAREACFEWALRENPTDGIYAGYSATQIRRIARERNAA